MNGDGMVSSDEIQTAFSRGSYSTHGVKTDAEFWKKLISEVDTNNDGSIDFQEFETYMMDLIKQGRFLDRTSSQSNSKEYDSPASGGGAFKSRSLLKGKEHLASTHHVDLSVEPLGKIES